MVAPFSRIVSIASCWPSILASGRPAMVQIAVHLPSIPLPSRAKTGVSADQFADVDGKLNVKNREP